MGDDTKPDEDAILARMLEGADRLCASGDAILAGQYRHLRARIDALIELRRTAAAA
jgi:hypothetical protein